MSLWHRMKVRLGLEDEWDDEYYDEDEAYADAPVEYEDDDEYASSRRSQGHNSPYGSGAGPNAVRRVDRTPDIERASRTSGAPLRSVPTGAASVTPVAPQVKMHIAKPKAFTEAQGLADKFKQGTPIILDLSGTAPDLAKRLLDFASGLTYGLDGGLSKVSDKVFMLTPHNVEVSDAEKRRLQSSGMTFAD
ncbi:MAG: cell division protein SepF [Actinobacteria bacterium]|nr:MAG: cell division protein SepF [Actinomycetota bacterium]